MTNFMVWIFERTARLSRVYNRLSTIVSLLLMLLAVQCSAQAQDTDWNEVRLAQTKHWPVTINPHNASGYHTIIERHAYYRWVQKQMTGRGIDSYFFHAATLITEPVTGIGAIDITGVTPSGLLLSPSATALFVELNKYLFAENVKTAAAMLLHGELTAKGRTRKLSMYGKYIDIALVEKEQLLAESFLKDYARRHPDARAAMKNISEALDAMAIAGSGYPVMHYMVSASNEIRAQSNNPRTYFDYSNLKDRVAIGNACVRQMRGAQQSKAQPFNIKDRIDTGVDVAKGEVLDISAKGSVDWFISRFDGRVISSDPDGSDNSDGHRGFLLYIKPPLPSLPNGNGNMVMVNDGTLIGYVASSPDDRGPYFVIGSHKQLSAPQAGRLFLLVNDGFRSDNRGGFQVSIKKP